MIHRAYINITKENNKWFCKPFLSIPENRSIHIGGRHVWFVDVAPGACLTALGSVYVSFLDQFFAPFANRMKQNDCHAASLLYIGVGFSKCNDACSGRLLSRAHFCLLLSLSFASAEIG